MSREAQEMKMLLINPIWLSYFGVSFIWGGVQFFLKDLSGLVFLTNLIFFGKKDNFMG